MSRVILQNVMDKGKLEIAHAAKRNPAVRAQQVFDMVSESAAFIAGESLGEDVSPSTSYQRALARADYSSHAQACG